MKHRMLLAALLAAITRIASAQSFDVASIRPAEQADAAGLRINGAQVRIAGLALKDYIAMAYRVKLYQVTGPDWITSQRFDVIATLPEGSSTAQVPEMLQALLADRFQLKLHREKKEFPVYAIEIGKGGLKLQESASAPEVSSPVTVSGSAQGVAVNLGRGSSYTFANNRFEAKKLTMAQLAGNLDRFLDRPVVDMTDLNGSYDFTLDVTPEDYRNMLIRAGASSGMALPPEALRLLDGAGEPVSLFDAAQKLGLKFEARKAPLELLVVDDARKTPTDN